MTGPDQPRPRLAQAGPSSTAIFLALRRMRTPLIVLIVLFSVTVAGLMIIPGVDEQGQPHRLDAFEAFYFMSYTATTIGFGEIPYPMTTAQRAWITVAIYLSVIAWAYAFGTVVSLMAERGFKEALRLQRFERQVARLREPFLLIAGFGQAGELLARSLDALDRRLVVVDIAPERIDALDLASFHSDVPGLVADARNPQELRRAGLGHPHCAGVVALTDDDEANLAVVMAAALLRPGLPVVARSLTAEITERMAAFGDPLIVDPFNLFGDELMLAVRAPHTARLIQWVTSDPGTPLGEPIDVPRAGRWIVAGYGRFGSHLAHDLQRHGVSMSIIDPTALPAEGVRALRGDGNDPAVLAEAGIGSAVAFAAATDNDTTNLSMLVAAKAANPDLFLVARQNQPVNGPLFDALRVDAVLVPTQLVAHEVLERIGSPALWRFVQHAQQRDDAWASALLDRLTTAVGTELADVWELVVDDLQCPAVAQALLGGDEVLLGSLMVDPEDRESRLDVVTLLLRRDEDAVLTPADDEPLALGDRLLLAGTSRGRGSLETVVTVPAALAYARSGARIGSSWLWRTFVDRA